MKNRLYKVIFSKSCECKKIVNDDPKEMCSCLDGYDCSCGKNCPC